MKIKTLISFLFFTILFFGCTPSYKSYNDNPLKVIVPKGFTQKEVVTEICNSLTNLHWKIDDIKENRVNAHLNQRQHNAKIVLSFSLSEITILNESTSTKINYANPDGKPTESAKSVPYGWLANLKREIEGRFNQTLNMRTIQKL